MKLAIIGYGKMGKLIESLAPEYGFTVDARIDIGDDFAKVAGASVVIEYSTPEAGIGNMGKVVAMKMPVVVGTTGWLGHMDQVRAAVEKNGSALIWSPNFSVGVNVFLRVVREAARLLADEAEYGAWAWEIHHDTKKDAQSGTMIKLVEEMRAAGYARNIDVSSSRAGRHPGTHDVGFHSAAAPITLRHTPRSREGVPRGALNAPPSIISNQRPLHITTHLS